MSIFPIAFSNEVPARPYLLRNYQSIEFQTSASVGFESLTIALQRRAGLIYNDTIIPAHIALYNQYGQICYEGRINQTPQSLNNQDYTYSVNGTGYASILSDLTSQWKPYYNVLTDTGSIIRDGLATLNTFYGSGYINYTTTTVPNTGRTVVYTPDGLATPRQHFDEMVKYGDSSNNRQYLQMWVGRNVYLKARPALTSPDYEITLAKGATVEMGQSADAFFTQLSIRYRTIVDNKVITVPDFTQTIASLQSNYGFSSGDATTIYNFWQGIATIQARYSTSFGTPSSSGVSYKYIREPGLADITGHGIITDAQAINYANTLLSIYSVEPRVVPNRVLIERRAAIRNVKTGMPALPEFVWAGKTAVIRDLPGSNPAYTPGQSGIFLAQTRYTEDVNNPDGTVEITGDNSNQLQDVMAVLLAGIPTLPE